MASVTGLNFAFMSAAAANCPKTPPVDPVNTNVNRASHAGAVFVRKMDRPCEVGISVVKFIIVICLYKILQSNQLIALYISKHVRISPGFEFIQSIMALLFRADLISSGITEKNNSVPFIISSQPLLELFTSFLTKSML